MDPQKSYLCDYIPCAPDVATCMFYTGLDPFTKQPVKTATAMCDRKMQKALMQFIKPENNLAVREALLPADPQDLIGNGCDALIPANQPKEAIKQRRKQATADYCHAVPVAKKKSAKAGSSYRPGRAKAGRRNKSAQ